jgi:hypothetical protein
MVERGIFPTVCGVALAAIEPEATFMRLITMMTGITILQRHREISEAARVDMTLYTGNTNMLTRELE